MNKSLNTSLIAFFGVENSAVRSLSATLKREGCPAQIIFLKAWRNNNLHPPTEREMDLLIDALREFKADLVGLSVPSSHYHLATMVTKRVRRELGVPVIWGGIHPTIRPRECISIADIICRGEGERPLVELVKRMGEGKPYDGIENLWIRSGLEAKRNPLRALIDDLDSLPYRDFDGDNVWFIDRDRVSREDPVFQGAEFRIYLTRGCPFSCTYCYNSSMRKIYKGLGKYWRIRSPGHVIGELKEIVKKFPRLKRVKFDDDTLPNDKEYLDEVCRLYAEEVGVQLECLLNPELVDRDLILVLKKGGLVRVQLGIQTASERETSAYSRKMTRDKLLELATMLRDEGLEVVYDIIADNPTSSEEDYRELFDLLLELPRPFNLFIYSLNFFPETELTRSLLDQGIIKESDVVGHSLKTYRQFRLGLDYPRPPRDLFWCSLYVMASKDFIPRWLLRAVSRCGFLKQHPAVVRRAAEAANFIKMGIFAWRMWRRGELTWFKIRQYSNIGGLLSQ